MANDDLRRRALFNTIALPVTVLTVVSGAVVWLTHSWHPGWGLPDWLAYLPALAGLALIGVGLSLAAATIRLFTAVGEGALGPAQETGGRRAVPPRS